MAYFKLDKKRARQRKKAGEENGPKGTFLSFGLGIETGSVVFFRKRERPAEVEKGTKEKPD